MIKNLFARQYFRISIFTISILFGIFILSFLDEIFTTQIQVQKKFSSQSLNQAPIIFEKNLGQAGSETEFLFQISHFTLQLNSGRAIITLKQPNRGTQVKQKKNSASINMNFINANEDAKGEGLNELLTKSNYLFGTNKEKWITDIPNYKRVRFSEIYPGVDLMYHGAKGLLEYDLIVSPGANPEEILFKIGEECETKLTENGDLLIQTDAGSIIFKAPIAYQELNDGLNLISANFRKHDRSSFGFSVDEYDETLPLVIDPVLVYSNYVTFEGKDIAIDDEGCIYVTGGGWNVFVNKYKPDLSEIIYSTNFGGDLDETGLGIVVDENGQAHITGETFSDNFPLENAIQEDFGGLLWVDGDAFVSKLNAEGNDFIYSTYLGGSTIDIGHDIALDNKGNAIIAGETWGDGFPVADAMFPVELGLEDIFITKLDKNGSLIFSTFFGGKSGDVGRGVAVDKANNIYITGHTWSDDFKTEKPYQVTHNSLDAFVTKMDSNGTKLFYSTYLTGAGNDPNVSHVDRATGIAVNAEGEAYVVGETFAPDFPMKNPIQNTHSGQLDGFITKFNSEGSQVLFSSYLGGVNHETELSIILGIDGNMLITGETQSSSFPEEIPVQNSLKGVTDGFFAEINSVDYKIDTLLYLGGGGFDKINGAALKSNGNVLVTGYTGSNDFPGVPPDAVNGGGFIAEIGLGKDNGNIVWKNITGNYSLPVGIKVYEGKRDNPKLEAFYIDADLNIPEISVRPFIRGSKTNVKNFNNIVGAYASVNGGFFYQTKALSAVVYPKDDLKAKNIGKVTREVNSNVKKYPVIRSLFSMKEDRYFSVDWIYHISDAIFTDQIFTYENPLPYTRNDPNPRLAPEAKDGEIYTDILAGIGGGPVLIKDGTIRVTYNEEILWGSGVEYNKRDPRTALGYTANKHIIMLVTDGRSIKSEGVGLPELAEIMFNLGCVEAINLDGGGSSQMAIDNSFVNNPSDPSPRAVTSIFSIVHTDLMNLNKAPKLNYIIDSESDNVEKVGGWTESMSPGAYGSSSSLSIPAGSGNNYIAYNLEVSEETEYELYAWWVAEDDRCMDTPFIINHKNGIDTVKVDQTDNGSFWNIIGNYTFTASAADLVKITDGGSGGFINADAIKIVSEEMITGINSGTINIPNAYRLLQNYPNPFNPITKIKYSLPERSIVTLKVFDVLGSELLTLVNTTQLEGNYQLEFNGSKLPSGVYYYRLQSGNFDETKKMILLK